MRYFLQFLCCFWIKYMAFSLTGSKLIWETLSWWAQNKRLVQALWSCCSEYQRDFAVAYQGIRFFKNQKPHKPQKSWLQFRKTNEVDEGNLTIIPETLLGNFFPSDNITKKGNVKWLLALLWKERKSVSLYLDLQMRNKKLGRARHRVRNILERE